MVFSGGVGGSVDKGNTACMHCEVAQTESSWVGGWVLLPGEDVEGGLAHHCQLWTTGWDDK